MKKILGLTVAVLLSIGMVGIGTWAYFSDVETSTGNVLTAGTLDLKTNDVDGVSQTLLATNMEPGDTIGPEIIILKNVFMAKSSKLKIQHNSNQGNTLISCSPSGCNPSNHSHTQGVALG